MDITSRITCTENVFEHCRSANKAKYLARHSGVTPCCIRLDSIGLPDPAKATNKDLENLHPAFIGLLYKKGPHYERMFDILERAESEPDAAGILLSFLKFPTDVHRYRFDMLGEVPKNNESFPFRIIHRAIAKDKRLLKWCRKAIESDNSAGHHEIVLASCIAILCSSQVEDKGLEMILQRRPSEEGNGFSRWFDLQFERLYKDLGKVAERMRTSDIICDSIQMLHDLAVPVKLAKGEKHCAAYFHMFYGTPANKSLLEALARVREELAKEIYVMHRQLLDPTVPLEDHILYASLLEKKGGPCRFRQEKSRNIEVCPAMGCSNQGEHSCSRCKLVRYCCRECQVAHWKHHKLVCQEQTTGS